MAALAAGPLGVFPRFFRWWLSELATLVPQWLRRRLGGTADRVVLSTAGGTATLHLEGGEEPKLLGRLDLANDEAAAREAAILLRQEGLDRAIANGTVGVCLRIAADRALSTIIDLPLAAETNLDEVVSFELDRHTPFRADQVLFTTRVIERNAATQRLTIEVLLVPRTTVAEMTVLAARLHLTPTRIDIAAGAGGGASDNLLRDNLRRPSGRGYRGLVVGLATAAAGLAVVAVALPILRAQHASDELARQFAAVKQVAIREAALQKEVDDLRRSELFLIEKKREMPSATALLFETTRILPDNTWLSDWQVSGRDMQMQGVTDSASALVGLIEQSQVFGHTTFLSPVVQDAAGHERFHIATQVTNAGKS